MVLAAGNLHSNKRPEPGDTGTCNCWLACAKHFSRWLLLLRACSRRPVVPAPACRLRHHHRLEVCHVSGGDQQPLLAVTLSLAGLSKDELPAVRRGTARQGLSGNRAGSSSGCKLKLLQDWYG
jgi:hypothetical protein